MGDSPGFAVWISGLQSAVCVPPKVREEVLGGMRKHLTEYVKLGGKKKKT
jgi:hypothetical protein